MANLVTIERPAGQSEAYLFVQDIDTGARFKVSHQQRLSDGGQLAVTFSAAPIDDDGHALLDPAGSPDVSTWTHTFTATELGGTGFDLEARTATVIGELVDMKQREIAGRAGVLAIGDMWALGSINLSKAGRAPGASTGDDDG